MTWMITMKPSYVTDFVELSKDLRKQASRAHAELEKDSITPRGSAIKVLTSWENLYRCRLGDYRLIYSATIDSHIIQLLAIGQREDVYDRFKYDPEADAGHTLTFSPELAAGLEPIDDRQGRLWD